MRDIRRWAIYYAPKAETALARFGADWLGWDAQAGVPRDGLDLPGLPRPRAEITAAPRKYGFHGTLRAPFPMADHREPAALDATVTGLAADFAPFPLALRVGTLGTFVALVPCQPCPAVTALAGACVRRLDAFRGGQDPAEALRRHPADLSKAQRAHLERWGYPFVFEEFRFHMSLTGPLGAGDRAAVARALDAALAPILVEPLDISSICLFGEDLQGMFHLLKRFPLRGPAAEAP